MITISAFGDEISPDLKIQMDVCEASGVHCIDVRGIDKVNVSQMPLDKIREYKKPDGLARVLRALHRLAPRARSGWTRTSAAHLDLLKRTCEIARGFGTDRIRVFSFYASQGARRSKTERGEP